MRSRAALAALLAATFAGVGPAAAADPTATPIDHFVVLMQENHSFDNYFGTFPGADGIPRDTCMPVPRAATRSRCVRPFRLGGRAAPDLPHDARTHRIQYARGAMDGFVRGASAQRQKPEFSVMGFYGSHDLPFHWSAAREYVLFDRFFAAAPGGSVANHLFWLTGTGGGHGGRIPEEGFGNLPTIFDRLEQRGISWKFYVEDYDPRLTIAADGRADRSTQAVRVPLLNFPRVVHDRKLFSHIVDLDEYYEDLERGTLPAVAYIAPAGGSEHPPGGVAPGQTLVRTLVNALARSDAWRSAAFMWTYDEWGGWFDHVRPPQGRGFRVPALLVSPYARRGVVDSTPLDHTSILRFIEDNWRLAPLAERDGQARSLDGAFDFAREPREPKLIAGGLSSASRGSPRRWLIYLLYGAAVMLAFGLIARVGSRRAQVPLAAMVGVCALGAAPPPAHASGVPPVIQTVPEVQGMRFVAHGVPFETDSSGRAYPPAALVGSRAPVRALRTRIAPGARARFDRWYRGGRIAALNIDYRVDVGFVDLEGNRVDPGVVSSVTLAGSNGRRQTFEDGVPWLQGNRVVPESAGRRSTAVSYAVERVVVGGSSVVHRAQQRFVPAEDRQVQLRLLLFSARFVVRDALLGFPIGSAVRLEYPSGHVQRHGLTQGADLTVRSLPRGDYRVNVDALGISSSRPVALSGDQRIELQVISWLDVVVVLLGLASLALGLLYLRRPTRAGSVAVALIVVVTTAMVGTPAARAAERPDSLFAYYYIWFNGSSWERAKTDYPLLGRYSSDDRSVMRQHVRWAKRAGIDGFIVSWKSTPVLNRRLERLAEVAAAEHFKLLVIYQGLDFDREPLPAARVGHDLDVFQRRFASGEAFATFQKPLVIWSGTWRFSRREIASRDGARRDSHAHPRLENAMWTATGAWPAAWTATPTTGRR